MILDLNPQPVDVTLECDPGEPVITWTLRPLTGVELARARQAAGPPPIRGRIVMRRVAAEVLDAQSADLNIGKQFHDRAGEACHGAVVWSDKSGRFLAVDMASDARPKTFKSLEVRHVGDGALTPEPMTHSDRAMAALNAADAKDHHDGQAWMMRHHEQIAAAALVSVNGEDVSDPLDVLAAIRPAALYEEAVRELSEHAAALSELDPKARASYASRCGSDGTQPAPGGPAHSANSPQPS